MRPVLTVLLASLTLVAQVPRLTEVQERRLSNGVRVLLVEQKGLGAFHATLAFRGGWAEEPPALAGATELLARAAYGATWPEDLEGGRPQAQQEALLKEEEGLLEALRLERLRQRRNPAADSPLPALEASLAALQARKAGQQSAGPLLDRVRAAGGRQSAEAGPDALLVHAELPAEAFATWCAGEGQRLRALLLSRFAPAREALTEALRAPGDPASALLRGAALPGHPYGRNLGDHLAAVEALRWSDLRAHARRTLSPERLMVVLVGDLSLAQAQPLLERHLGSLPVPPAAEEAPLPEVRADLGDRQVQAVAGADPRLLVAWRTPPRSHPDHLPLRLAARLLDGGRAGELTLRLARQRRLVRSVAVALDVPGGRLPGLLTVDLVAEEGHALAEVEAALHGEVLRLHQEALPHEAWTRALAALEMEALQALDQPAHLARALALAWAEAGDWRLVDLEVQRLRTLSPETVQAAVRTWLVPSHRTTLHLAAAPAEDQDPLEAALARALTALTAARVQDLAQRERLVAEGLRQLRMLGPEERRQALRILEAQAAAVRR